MKNIFISILFIILSNIAYTQSLTIYKTDESTVKFQLSDIDSITFSVTSLSKPVDSSSDDDISGESIDHSRNTTGLLESVIDTGKNLKSADEVSNYVLQKPVSEYSGIRRSKTSTN